MQYTMYTYYSVCHYIIMDELVSIAPSMMTQSTPTHNNIDITTLLQQSVNLEDIQELGEYVCVALNDIYTYNDNTHTN